MPYYAKGQFSRVTNHPSFPGAERFSGTQDFAETSPVQEKLGWLVILVVPMLIGVRDT